MASPRLEEQVEPALQEDVASDENAHDARDSVIGGADWQLLTADDLGRVASAGCDVLVGSLGISGD